MKTPFLFRPAPGWSVSSKTALDMGLDVSGAPLFTVEPVDWEVPDPEQFDGLLIGSANVFRHGGKQIDRLTKLPVHAVGDATADAARNAGFLIGRTGRGGLQSLLDELDGRELHLLRLAGEDRVTLRLPEKIRIETKIVYRAVPQSMTDDDIARLRTGGVVALHSGAAAERLQVEFDRHEMDRSQVDLAVIGPRVAEMAGEGWRSVEIADAPGDSELLALARALCQTDE